jgi:hypothetical protein
MTEFLALAALLTVAATVAGLLVAGVARCALATDRPGADRPPTRKDTD